VIGPVNEFESGSLAQPVAHSGYQVELSELITRPLEEEHRKIYLVEVVGSPSVGLPWRVKREAEEGQTPQLG
jgi:hypothetical protein